MTTGIDYLDEVWSPITGCSGKGCKAHCWARDMARRFPQLHGYSDYNEFMDERVDFSKPHFHPNRLDKPLHWKKPRRVGVCFMGDFFDSQVGVLWQHQIYEVIRKCPQHQFFILTKQAENMRERLEGGTPLENVWHGVSPTDQADADRVLPELLKVPGKRWLSIEPMLGPVTFQKRTLGQGSDCPECGYMVPVDEDGCCAMCGQDAIWYGIDWIVLGCESGPKRRPCPHEWMIDVVRQCKSAGTPVYVKQVNMGKRVSHDPADWPEELRRRELP